MKRKNTKAKVWFFAQGQRWAMCYPSHGRSNALYISCMDYAPEWARVYFCKGWDSVPTSPTWKSVDYAALELNHRAKALA